MAPRTLLFWSMGSALLSSAWLLLLGYAGGTLAQIPVETVLLVTIVLAVGVLFVSIPMIAGAVLGLLCGAWFREHLGLDREDRRRMISWIFWPMGFALLSTAWLHLLESAGMLGGRPPHTLAQTVLLASIGIAEEVRLFSTVMIVFVVFMLLLAWSKRARPRTLPSPQTPGRKRIFFVAWYQEYLRRDQEYRSSTERPPLLLGMAYAVLFMAYVGLMMAGVVVPVMNYVQGPCSTAWECLWREDLSSLGGWFLLVIFFAMVLDWIGKRVMLRRRPLPSASS
jgi:hypothetical protein